MLDFCIIGSGISGSTIANLLNKKYSVAVYDKARGYGGRSSFKKYKDKVGFDHGLQYISPKSKKFKTFTNQLIKKKILKKWEGNHLFLHKTVKEIKNHLKLIGTKGNNSISKHLLKKIKCNFEHELTNIKRLNDHWELTFKNDVKQICKNLILTCPFPQSKKLGQKYLNKSYLNQKVKMDANLTVMIVTNKLKQLNSSYFFNDDMLGWAAYENSKKRFKFKYDLWTLQSTYKYGNKFTKDYRNKRKYYTNQLVKKFEKLTKLKIKKIHHSRIHGWMYSSNSKPLKQLSLWNKSLKLGLCGDYFGGPRLENGWQSAHDLHSKIRYGK